MGNKRLLSELLVKAKRITKKTIRISDQGTATKWEETWTNIS